MSGDILVLENGLNDVWAVASTDAEATIVMFFNDRSEEVSLTFTTPVSGGTATIALWLELLAIKASGMKSWEHNSAAQTSFARWPRA